MTNNVNFDELTRKAFAPDWTDDDQRKLYTALLSLPEWHFIAVGEFPNAAPFYAVFPGYLDNLPLITAFTDDERLRSYVAKNNTSNGAGYAPIVIPTGDGFIEFSSDRSSFSFAPETFFKLLENFFNHGIRGIIFNHGGGTPFFVELRQFRSIYDYLINENALAKTGVETDVENNADHLTKLLEENADVIARFEQENMILSTIIKIKAKEVDAASEENREQIISKMLNDLESVRVENNMPPKLFRVFIESCLNEKKFLMPALAFAYVQQDKEKWEKLEQDKEFVAEYANWLIKKIIPGAELLMDEPMQKPVAAVNEKIAENDFQTDTAQEKDFSADETGEKKSAASGVDFDELSRRIDRANPPMEDLNALYGAAFALPEWMFIARGELLNPRPYIASNPAYADNQAMVRAFTDGERMIRFARENNLTDADGGCSALSIPVGSVVEYLEGFIEQGAYGIWFNSDSESAGFFVPIKQLRPIKEHLEKIKQTTAETEFTALLVTITDGLSLPSGFVKKSDYNCNFFCWIPRQWTESLQLKPEYLEKLYEQFYGAGWRSGNSDGSRYVVIESNSAVMSPERVKDTKWNLAQNTELNRYWYYIGDANGAFRNVSADEFQTLFDASLQTRKQGEAQKQQDNLANYGVSETSDGEIDLNLTVNKVGAVGFETSIAPFYDAIVPLLEDYKGAGDYITLLRFEPGGKSDEVENIAENSHGAYLQIRRFSYLNPKNGVRIGVNSIHSNNLRHVESNAELLVSFELCKNLDNQTAVFYHAFQGAGSNVKKLLDAIEPILANCGYQAVQ